MTREEICENLKTIITQINETIGNRYEGINSTYIANIKPNSLRFVIEEAIKALEQAPCEDAINRQAVIKVLINNGVHFGDMVKITSDIKDLPPVNPQEPKTGHWIEKEGREQGYDIAGIKTWYIQIMCDKCGFIKTAIEGHTGQYHFCPNCGARMAESEEV